MSHAEVIREFGGSRRLAEAIGVKPELAIHWPKRGIPAKFWSLVEATEIGRRIGITALQLKDLPRGATESAKAA